MPDATTSQSDPRKPPRSRKRPPGGAVPRLVTGRWLVKTEPSAYAYADLAREGRTAWEGVSNPLALIHLRSMREGDLVLVYHTGPKKAVTGLARVVRPPYVDPSTPRKKNANDPEPLPSVVDFEPVAAATTPVTLAMLRSDPACASLDLLRLSRLSVMPVTLEAFAAITQRGGLPTK